MKDDIDFEVCVEQERGSVPRPAHLFKIQVCRMVVKSMKEGKYFADIHL